MVLWEKQPIKLIIIQYVVMKPANGELISFLVLMVIQCLLLDLDLNLWLDSYFRCKKDKYVEILHSILSIEILCGVSISTNTGS